MKKLRSINTNVWDDVWFVELEPEEKLIWLYLLTNPLTNLIGIYEISKKKIQFDTGIESFERVSKALERFEKDGKAFYFSNHIILVNFFANQSYNTNMLTGAKNMFNELPNELINRVASNPLKGFERLRNGLAIVRKDEEEVLESEVLESEYKSDLPVSIKFDEPLSENDLREKNIEAFVKAGSPFLDVNVKVPEGILTEDQSKQRYNALLDALFNSQQWYDNICMHYNIPVKSATSILKRYFAEEIQLKGNENRDLKFAKSRFVNWYNANYNKKQQA